MEQASFFIEKKALFGGYPNHKQIIKLQSYGVTWFIDLTHPQEKNIKVYSFLTNNWINYPIKDRNVPQDNKNFLIFLLLIQMAIESLKPGEKIYLHCRGGHGRSTLVIACFLGLVLKIPPQQSLDLAKEYHLNRPNLREKWLNPLNIKQHKFVESFFGQLYLYSNFNLSSQTTPKSEFLNQNKIVLDTLLNSGCKNIIGEGLTSTILQELRSFILQSQARKIFSATSWYMY